MRTLPAVLAAVAVLLSAAPVSAQGAAQASLTIDGLEEQVAANGTQAVLPIRITFNISGAPCLGQSATYEAVVEAALADATATGPSAHVEPATVTFSFGPSETLTGATRTADSALVVENPDGGAVNVTVNARITGVGGCGPIAGAPTAEDEVATTVVFPSQEKDEEGTDSTDMPGPGLALAGLAVIAVALALRRRA